MKAKTSIYSLILLFVCISAYGQKAIDTQYDFPVKPGSKQWASYNSHEEMVIASDSGKYIEPNDYQSPCRNLSELST